MVVLPKKRTYCRFFHVFSLFKLIQMSYFLWLCAGILFTKDEGEHCPFIGVLETMGNEIGRIMSDLCFPLIPAFTTSDYIHISYNITHTHIYIYISYMISLLLTRPKWESPCCCWSGRVRQGFLCWWLCWREERHCSKGGNTWLSFGSGPAIREKRGQTLIDLPWIAHPATVREISSTINRL